MSNYYRYFDSEPITCFKFEALAGLALCFINVHILSRVKNNRFYIRTCY